MKSQNSLLKLKKFHVEEKGKQLARLDTMIDDFSNMAQDLERQINHEETKSGISDVKHFAYSTFAKAARKRRDNLLTSLEDLKNQRSVAKLSLMEAQETLDKAQKLGSKTEKIKTNKNTIAK